MTTKESVLHRLAARVCMVCVSGLLVLLPLERLVSGQPAVSGVWQAEVSSGNTEEVWTLRLTQTGRSLTGSIAQGAFRGPDVWAFSNGVVRGTTVAFEVQVSYERRITFTGEIDGEDIHFVREVEVFPAGNPGGAALFGAQGPVEFTMSRLADGEAPLEPRGMPFPRELTVFDREGEAIGTIGERGYYQWLALSPSGERMAVVEPHPSRTWVTSEVDPGISSEVRNLRVFDLQTEASTVIASGQELMTPVWSPDGASIAYFTYRDGRGRIDRTASDGTGSEELLHEFPLGVIDISLNSWSSDGRLIAFNMAGTSYVLPVGGEPVELVREEYEVLGASLSPDGRWMAYMSNESGSWAVYIREFDSASLTFPDAARLLAEAGDETEPFHGAHKRVYWRRDGGELYYQAGDLRMVAVEVDSTIARPGSSRLLFRSPGTGRGWNPAFLSVSGDGRRFVMAVPRPPQGPEAPIAAATLSSYAGTYALPLLSSGSEQRSDEFIVTLQDGRLWSQAPGEQESIGPMIPGSDTTFYTGRLGEEIEFLMDDEGNVTHLVRYRGFGVRAERKSP